MKTVVITGTSRGIGEALKRKFLQEGYFVIGTSTLNTSHDSLDNFVQVQLDLSNQDSIEECYKKIDSLNKDIDILINNAGALFDEDETKVVIEKLRKSLEVNTIGVIEFTERIIPKILRGGHILNITSSSGSMANTKHMNWPSYAISKAALNMYTRKLSFCLNDVGVTVSSVHPGFVKTDMGGDRGLITPEEAAKDIYLLATSQIETGQFWHKGEIFPW